MTEEKSRKVANRSDIEVPTNISDEQTSYKRPDFSPTSNICGKTDVQEIQFLLLPGKVRNMIYRYLISDAQLEVDVKADGAMLSVPQELSALLQVNRQIREEAQSHNLALNKVVIEAKHLNTIFANPGNVPLNKICVLVLDFTDTFISDRYRTFREIVKILRQISVEGRLHHVVISVTERVSRLEHPTGADMVFPYLATSLVWTKRRGGRGVRVQFKCIGFNGGYDRSRG